MSTFKVVYAIYTLRDAQTQEGYKLNLSDRFNVLQDLQEEGVKIDDMWQGLKE